MRTLTVVARILLGLILVASGVLKGMSPYHSVLTVGGFDLTPAWVSFATGITLPGVEVVAGVALLTGVLARGAALIAMGLGASFAAGVGSVMARRLDIDCGCFGHLAFTPRAGWGTIGFDATLVLLGLVVLLGTRPRPVPPISPDAPPPPAEPAAPPQR